MPTYGSNSTMGYGTAGSGQLRGSVYGVWPDNAWVTSISARLGRTPNGSNPSVRMGLYTTEQTHPHSLVGQTAAFAVSAAMDHGGGGQVYTSSFQGGALRVSAGGNYAIGIVGTGASLNHAMVHAASSPFTNRNLYYRNGVTGSLPNPFGYTSSSYEGNISAWVEYTVNRAPTATTTSPTGLQTSTSVTLIGGFSDPDSGFGDRMHSFEIELWNATTNTRIWTTGWRNASSSEAQNNQYRYTVTVPAGVNLRFRARVRDQFQLASGWSAYRAFNVHLNRAPSATTSVPNGLETSTTVNFQGTFSDPDTPITGDTFSRFQFQVRNDATNATVHDSGELVPNATEIANKRFNRNVNLTAGVPFSWRARVRDNHGAWSAYTGWRTFTINAGPNVDTFGGVTGKQNSQQPTPFTFVYRHDHSLSMNRYQIRIGQGSQVIRTGEEVASTASINATVTATWADSFGTYQLPWGSKNVWWEVRVRDSANAWTGFRSTNRTFNINSAPTLPSNLTPSNSAASPERPVLRCRVTDEDGDTLTVKARIKNSAGTVLHTRTMTHVGDGWYEYQTITSDLTDWGTFRWDARATDGVLWTGTQTSEANAQHSSEVVFIYADVPNVVLTSPIEDDTYAGTVTVSWEPISNQYRSRIVIFDVSTSEQIVGDWSLGTHSQFTLTAANKGFRKGRSYKLHVEVTDTNMLEGQSATINFHIDYPAPSAIEGFVALPEHLGVESSPSAVRLTWEPYEEGDFIRYVVTRFVDGVPLVISAITNPFVTEYLDYIAPTNVDVEYSIVLVTMQGLDELQSEPMSSSTTINVERVILQSVLNPSDSVSLEFVEDRDFEHINDGVEVLAWGATAPTMVFGTTNYQRIKGTFLVIDTEFQSARHILNNLRTLWQSKKTLCYRDERGRRLFGHITSFNEIDTRVGGYEIELEIVQTQYVEGVPV